jgi:hypothetical protein
MREEREKKSIRKRQTRERDRPGSCGQQFHRTITDDRARSETGKRGENLIRLIRVDALLDE